MNAQPSTTPLVFADPTADVAEATRVANASYELASGMLIDSAEGYQDAANELVDLRQRWIAVEKQRVHLKEPHLEGCRRIDAFFKVPLDRLASAADVIKQRMLVFKTAEDRKAEEARRAEEQRRRAEREKLEREQREAAAREREAREEAERVAREARERAEAEARAAREAAAAAAAKGDQEARERAEAAEQAARDRATAEAEAARQKAAEAALHAQQQAAEAQDKLDLVDLEPAPPAVVSSASARGVASRRTWVVLSVDKVALVQAAAAALERGDDSLLAYLVVDEKVLGGIAKSLKGAARVPGVTFGERTTLASTGRR